MAEKLKLALLAGGRSSEREVSLNGGEEVYNALDKSRYDIVRYDPATDLVKLAADASKIDVAFILLHGPFGEDGTMQGFLDMLDIPYQSSGVLGSSMAMDKHIAKLMYRQAGLTVPEWETVEKGADWSQKDILRRLGLPLVIKPLTQGSSVGMSIVDSSKELASAVEGAFQYDHRVIIEEFISGREITGGVLGIEELTALPLVEIIPGDQYRFFDYEAKYKTGATREVCPAEIDDLTTVRAQENALAAHRALMLEVYSRTDMIFNDKGVYVLETNTIPGMTPTSLLPQAAEAYGLSFSGFLDRLIELALEKKHKGSIKA